MKKKNYLSNITPLWQRTPKVTKQPAVPIYFKEYKLLRPMPVAAQSKAWICGRLLAEIVGSNPPWQGCLSRVNVVCCLIEVSASG